MKHAKIFLVVLAALSPAGCTVAGAPLPGPTQPPPSPVPGTQPHAAVASGIVAEANRARQRAGVQTLAGSGPLDRVAQEYAEELARRGVLDHASPTPGRETMGQRITAGGVQWRRAAENLAYRTGPAGDVPRNVVTGWLGSPGHATNLLEPAYTHTGVGVAQAANGRWYIVQLYVLPVSGAE